MNVYKFTDIFWPTLEKEIAYSKDITPKLLKCDSINEGEEDIILNRALACLQEEEDRRKSIESKAALFVGVITISTTLVITFTKSFVEKENFVLIDWVQFSLLSMLAIYLVRTIWFAVKTLEKGTFSCLEVTDYIESLVCRESRIELIKNIIIIIEKNADVTNKKIDSMTLAQLYFKRAATILGIYVLFAVLYKIATALFPYLF